ncbi:helix-turn-helix transcriptional regulator [Allopusillimonas ginsengisoli]|uniref:helix-turn-helix transcriptional regulator n=1 Tax=Allopusillimonas ginsengisoli TaxID=453575 RepID=UPI001022812B|nr:helix-turn-helix transcriptional regulator [Allopusillimonas ginsengisoli]TEA69489.1 helix-turn-helix transcriptional regulator [Allopusillimonas ginsengisoli]
MGRNPAAPPSGRHQLQQIIAGLTEGVILIEPDGSIAWANQAALAMHDAGSLQELGATAQGYCDTFSLTYRNNHRLQADQYPIMRALAGEAFSEVVVEMRSADEACYRVLNTHSVMLDDEAGARQCVVLVLNDVTERYSAEDRFEKTFNANPAPALICRLSDFRYVRVNQGFLEMTGYVRDQVLGRSAYELDVLANADKREQAIANIGEGRTVPQMEAVLQLPGGGSKYVIVAGQPIEVNEEGCMLFTFIDLDPRKQTEDALRHTEERFSKAFRLAPVPMILSTLAEFRLLEVNDAFINTTGYAKDTLINQTLAASGVWASPGEYRKLEAQLEDTGSVRNYGIQLCTQDNVHLDCLVSAETVTIHGERCVLGVIQDITAHKQSESELIAAIETVMQDTSWFSRTVIEKLAQIRRPPGAVDNKAAVADLTVREREVLGLMCEGMSDEEIGEKLHLSRNTVRNHVATIYNKIDVHRRSAAIIWGRERGIVGYEKPVRGRKQ